MRLSPLPRDDIAGEIAIVTGGSRGLGLEIARELGRNGCRLLICARDRAELGRAADLLRSEGFPITTVACDITDADAPRQLIDAALERYGGLDIVVNNAGVIQVAPAAAGGSST